MIFVKRTHNYTLLIGSQTRAHIRYNHTKKYAIKEDHYIIRVRVLRTRITFLSTSLKHQRIHCILLSRHQTCNFNSLLPSNTSASVPHKNANYCFSPSFITTRPHPRVISTRARLPHKHAYNQPLVQLHSFTSNPKIRPRLVSDRQIGARAFD